MLLRIKNTKKWLETKLVRDINITGRAPTSMLISEGISQKIQTAE